MNIILAVFKRNLTSYLSGVLGYLFMASFLAGAALAAFNESFFANNLANLDQLNLWFPALLVGLIPAITMSSWADERRFGTDELLFTLPGTDLQILIGKYLAAVGVYTVTLAFALVGLTIALFIMGSPDLGIIFSAFVGYWFAGSALVAAGMVASAATRSPTVAYLLGLLTTGIPAAAYQWAPTADLSVSSNLREFGLGIVSPAGVVYFLSLTALMLFINYVLITGRFWSTGAGRAAALVGVCSLALIIPIGLLAWLHTAGSTWPYVLGSRVGIAAVLAGGVALSVVLATLGKEWSQAMKYGTEFVALAVTLVSLNHAVSAITYRFDFTTEKLYSLTQTTNDLLAGLKPEQTVRIHAFISPEVPKQYAATRNTLIGMLRQYGQDDNIIVRIADTRPFTKEAEEAKRFNIEPQEVRSEQGARVVTNQMFLGVALTSGNNEVVIPTFDMGTPVEYELTRSIHTLTQPKRKRVGILRTDAKAGGGFDMSTFQQTPEWRIVQELKKQYEVKDDVDPADLANQQFDVLIAFMPSSLTDTEYPNLVSYVKNGNPTLIIDDPYPMFHGGLAPKSEKPRPGGMQSMFGGGPPPQPKAEGGSLKSLLDVLQLDWTVGETVWDSYDPELELTEIFRPYNVVYVGAHSGGSAPFNADSPITKGLQEVMLFYPGALTLKKGATRETHKALLRGSPLAYLRPWEDYTETSGGFMGMGGARPILNLNRLEGDQLEHVMAYHVQLGKKGDDKAKGVNAVFVADLDLISDEFFFVRDKEWNGLQLDNIAFVLNCVDVLAGDPANVELRKRRGQHRTLTRVDAFRREVRLAEIRDKKASEDEAENAEKTAQQQFDDQRKKIEEDKSLTEEEKRRILDQLIDHARRRMAVEKAEIKAKQEAKGKQIHDKAQADILSLENWFRLGCVLGIPLPSVLLGLVILTLRMSEENLGVIPDRMIKKKR